MGRKFPPYNPASGVRTDFEKLLQQFTDTESVRYEQFAEIWRDMKLSHLASGRQDEREAGEFLEEVFKIAIQYYLPPYNFQVRVGGLYLLYGLFFTQPLLKKCKIRVTPEIWMNITDFQNEAHRQEHLDVEFIFHKLRYNDAFEFCATQTEVYPSGPKESVNEESVATKEEFKDEQSVLYDLFSTEVLEQLAAVHQHYHRIKVAINGPYAEAPSKSLDVIHGDLVPGLTKAVLHYQDKRKSTLSPRKKGTATDTEDDEEAYAMFLSMDGGKSSQSSVKSRAYRKLAKSSKSRRHRQAKSDTETDQKGFNLLSPSDSESPKKRTKRKKVTLETEPVADKNPGEGGSSTLNENVLNMPVLDGNPDENKQDVTDSPATTSTAPKPTADKAGKGKRKRKPQVDPKMESSPAKQKLRIELKSTKRGKKRGPKKDTVITETTEEIVEPSPKKKARKTQNSNEDVKKTEVSVNEGQEEPSENKKNTTGKKGKTPSKIKKS